jgi:hypothetical protein
MPTPCRRHHPADVLPRYLLCPDDALDVLWAVEAEHPDASHIVLVVDRDRRAFLAMPIRRDAGAAEPTMEALVDLLVGSLAGNPEGPMGVVLCSLRPGKGVEAQPADLVTWDRLQARCRDMAVDLLDWFLVDCPDATSMTEMHGCGWPEPLADD